jgi:hypothetical protein
MERFEPSPRGYEAASLGYYRASIRLGLVRLTWVISDNSCSPPHVAADGSGAR